MFIERISFSEIDAKREAILFLFGFSEVNSSWIITSRLANQRVPKSLFTCVVYTNYCYFVLQKTSLLSVTMATVCCSSCSCQKPVIAWIHAVSSTQQVHEDSITSVNQTKINTILLLVVGNYAWLVTPIQSWWVQSFSLVLNRLSLSIEAQNGFNKECYFSHYGANLVIWVHLIGMWSGLTHENKIWANFLPLLRSHETTLKKLIWLGKGAISTLHKTKTTHYFPN